MRRERSQRGVVLVVVLVLVMLLSASLYVFMRRVLADTLIARNRDGAAQAEALARGGVRLARASILDDRIARAESGGGHALRPFAGIELIEIDSANGDALRVEVAPTTQRVNLNALVRIEADAVRADEEAEEYLVDLLGKVIDELAIPPGEKIWDPRELARNLLDYLDDDDVSISGGAESEDYAGRPGAAGPANRPLLSVDELRLVSGFDAVVVDALRPYVTVHPLRPKGEGVDPNAAPPHVLAAISHGVGGDRRLVDEDRVRAILRSRQEGRLLCDQTESDPERCVTPQSLGIEGSFYPPTALPLEPTAFRVTSTAAVGAVRRQLVAVVDIRKPAEPRLLSFRFE